MKIDMHIHTNDSFDCSTSIESIMYAAYLRKIDGICLTDHNVFKNGSSIRTQEIKQLAKEYDLLVMRGCEVSTDLGHFLCYGLKDDSWNIFKKSGPYIKAQWLIDHVNGQGGMVVAAHPFRGDTFQYKPGTYKPNGHYGAGYSLEKLNGLAGIEVYNGGNSPNANIAASSLARKMRLPAFGGSDAHFAKNVGRCFTVAPDSIRSMWDLIQYVKRGSKSITAGRLEG